MEHTKVSHIPIYQQMGLAIEKHNENYLTSPKMKYLGVNLKTKNHVQHSFQENYKTLAKEIKEQNKWRDI